jgi:hypothetical protein
MLYSLGAMTTYGIPSVNLEPQWQLMGVVESLNGVILFGFTVATAVLNQRQNPGRDPQESTP